MSVSGDNGQPASQAEIDRAREEVDHAKRRERNAGPTELRSLVDRLNALLAELHRLRGRVV